MFRKNLSLSECDIKLDQSGSFAGYASVFGGVDNHGDTIEKGAFAEGLEKNGLPKMFFNHDGWGLPIGRWAKAEEDERGLYVEGELTPGNSKSEDIRAALKHGTVDGLSIGFYMSKNDYKETDHGRLIKRVPRLVEVSVVTFPADGAARIDLASVKSDIEQLETIRDFENFLRDAGRFSKGLAGALVSRAKEIFAQGEPGAGEIDAKAMQELQDALSRFRVPASLNG